MTLPFWPKIAAASDAPNYQPTAGDDRCGVCAYFRSLNDGSGYCEKFSFQCEPQSVCDDFVATGNVKTSAAPVGRLSEFMSNPVVQRAAYSGGAGAVSGAGFGARGSGEDRLSEGAKGALIGGALGSTIGLAGPASRSMKAQRLHAEAENSLRASLKNAVDRRKTLKQLLLEFKKKPAGPEKLEAAGKYRTFLKGGRKPSELNAEIADLESKLKDSKYVPDLAAIASPGSVERYGAPALSALMGGIFGHGLSHDSKEQNRFRKSKSQ